MAIELAAGIGMSLIATEHMYSSMLSSPPTTQRFFADSDEGKRQTQKMLLLAASLSLATACVLSGILKSVWPLIATIILVMIYWSVYIKAMEGKL